ncbi:MAG: hypothetical protein WA629_03965, partial [Candidatus Aquilonibacter sp.]
MNTQRIAAIALLLFVIPMASDARGGGGGFSRGGGAGFSRGGGDFSRGGGFDIHNDREAAHP